MLLVAWFLGLVHRSGDPAWAASPEPYPAPPGLIRSIESGPWSAPTTWEGGAIPTAGARVQVRAGHAVRYDIASDTVIRSIHVAGTLAFAGDRDTRLAVGLIKIQAGDDASEDGFDCDAHPGGPVAGSSRPVLEVGSADRPIGAEHTAVIRLTYVAGMDRQTCPSIICCGGRMDFHGAPMSRTWVKLGATAPEGARHVTLAEPVTGWRVGDRVIITATRGDNGTGGTRKRKAGDHIPSTGAPKVAAGYRTDAEPGVPVYTEERILRSIDGGHLTLDLPLDFEHLGDGAYRGEVANLSRNVIVESADPGGVRGHTMYHRDSAGSVSYAEFRHLGKEGVLGKYSLHFHRLGDTMRGSSVVGASIWDSGNRWITIHGTNYLVVRDCVGYQSVGHGFFLEDGTEVNNVLDRNLAVQSFVGKKLPEQVLPFDHNEGAGFWWANSRNSFTRNVTCENDRYGYRFEATPNRKPGLRFPVLQADGSRQEVDIRTLPFVRFEGNESHCDGKYGLNLGEGVDRIGPDTRHPFVIKDTKIWKVHYAFRPESPSVLVDGMTIYRADYGVYNPNFDHHVYRGLAIIETDSEPFNRGLDDLSVQNGPLAVDGLTFDGISGYADSVAMIQISDNNPTGSAVSYFRNVRVLNRKDKGRRPLANVGGGTRTPPNTPRGVPVYLLDHFGAGRHAKVVSTRALDLLGDGGAYRAEPPLTGDLSRVAEVRDLEYPTLLEPTSDLPPATVITRLSRAADGSLHVRGTSSSNGAIKAVRVNGQSATPVASDLSDWEVTMVGGIPSGRLVAGAEAASGLKEATPHELPIDPEGHAPLAEARPGPDRPRQ
jgi:G8 domain